MEWLIYAFLLIIIPLFLFIVPLKKWRKLPPPPGPPGLPIIGNMLMMDQLTHRGLDHLSKIYGGIFQLRLGYLNAVTISKPEMARQVLQVQDNIFSNRPATMTITYLTYDRSDLAFANYGPFWRQMRKLCVLKLLSRRCTDSWASVRDNIDSTVKTVATKIGSSIDIRELGCNLTKAIIFRAAFGAQISIEDRDEFTSIVEEFSRLFGAFHIGDFIPWLKWMDFQGINKRLKRARLALDQFIDRIIDEHLANPKEVDAPTADMVDGMLVFLREVDGGKVTSETGDDLQEFAGITRNNIKAVIMDIMFGGTGSIANIIEWTMAELLKNPKEMKLVQQELAEVIGMDCTVKESDLDSLSYLKCVIKETLRLHPPTPLLLHETAENCEVAGYFITKQSRVMINVWSIGRDKSAWEDADLFKPGRFAPDGDSANIDFKGNFFQLLPFGSGRRSCPGIQLGVYAVELALANLLHSFDWTLPDGMKSSELDMGDTFGLTAPKAVHLVAVPSLRLNYPSVRLIW
ncbi:hypothetical protein LUZ63_002103 [Rhynchospora breviuscula]|uniref:Cytochrome P450 n=1 Tax=Rhynchospora breviuscula TaxID=2022672 RepID=A0A9Q0CY44_9POAL|nr:hypothetical protein LUZ63_002103 [Rhynchospora breviuscula]